MVTTYQVTPPHGATPPTNKHIGQPHAKTTLVKLLNLKLKKKTIYFFFQALTNFFFFSPQPPIPFSLSTPSIT